MTCDHVAYIFVSPATNLYWLLRIIGRLTMPIMAFFAAAGVRRTRSMPKYLLRLFIFALLAELPFRLAFAVTPVKPWLPSDVIFTIFLGVLAVYLGELAVKKTSLPLLRLIPYAVCMLTAGLLELDWTWLGVLMIIVFYEADGNKIKQVCFLAGAYAVYIIADAITAWLDGTLVYGLTSPIHLFGLCCLPLLFAYNGKRGAPKAFGYFFYVYYPAHLTVLWLIAVLAGTYTV